MKSDQSHIDALKKALDGNRELSDAQREKWLSLAAQLQPEQIEALKELAQNPADMALLDANFERKKEALMQDDKTSFHKIVAEEQALILKM